MTDAELINALRSGARNLRDMMPVVSNVMEKAADRLYTLNATVDMAHSCPLDHFPSTNSCRCREAVWEATSNQTPKPK